MPDAAHTYTYHGIEVADPYRWLEDPDSSESRAWIDAQNSLTTKYLDGIASREEIRKRLRELWNFEKYSVPREEDGQYFFKKNDGLQNQSVLYTTRDLSA